jgi:hypothetical protein
MTSVQRDDLLARQNGIAQRDCPSVAGAVVGKAMALMSAAGLFAYPDMLKPCATCAFRAGAMSNAMPATVTAAFECVATNDDVVFGCHQGMIDNRPARECAGWRAAKAAPSTKAVRILADMFKELEALGEHDHVRAEFDDWVARVDPDGRLDDHERGRLWLRDHPANAAAGTDVRV